MDIEQASQMVRDALLMALTVASPMLLIGLVVGVLVSLVQAVTQIQEQTLTFVPKITAMIIAAIIFLPWIANRLLDYARDMFGHGL